MDKISDLAYDPVEEADYDEQQNQLVTLRHNLKKGEKNNEKDK